MDFRRAAPEPRGELILSAFRFIESLRDVAEGYDGFILDLWGVVHDGKAAYPGALAAMRAVKAAGKPVLLLSNAPRRGSVVKLLLDRLGVPPETYDFIVTSGDLVHAAIEAGEADLLGGRCVRISPERDHGLLDGLDLELVEGVGRADFLLVTGLHDDERETAETYRPVLLEALAGGLPLVCANPDRSVMRGPMEVPCAGAIAELYEEMGGRVLWFGKPAQGAYRTSLGHLGLEPGRVLAVGDSFRTDIAGAVAAGIDCLFVAGGLHVHSWGIRSGDKPAAALIEADAARFGAVPTYVIPLLAW